MEQLLESTERTPEEILQTLGDRCRPYGEVLALGLFCQQEKASDTLCMIEMTGGLSAAASAISGQIFGGRICRHWRLPADFRCSGRPEGKPLLPTCDNCHVRVRPTGAGMQASARG